MRHAVLVLASLVLAATAEKSVYEGYKVFNCLDLKDNAMDQLLKYCQENNLDVWFASRTEARVEVMVAPEAQQAFYAYLEQNHVRYELMIHNVQETIRYENRFSKLRYEDERGEITFNKYHSYYKINEFLAEMAAKHPRLASVVTIGKSTEGRDLNVIKISRGGNNPIIWIDAGIHAREWIAPAMALYIINQLLEVPANSALLDGVDWHILPVVNPDGYQWSFTNDRFWRKTRSNTVCRSPKAGVDANRNFNYMWQATASNQVCSETYSGSRPFSEPESAAMRDHLLAHRNRLKLYLSFHSFGPYIFHPWAWTTAPPPDRNALHGLAIAANAALTAVGGESAEVGSPAHLLYKAQGSSFDWVRGIVGVNLSYTIELPGGGMMGFDLPTNRILPTVSAYFQAVRVFGNHVRMHYRGGR